MTRYLAADNPSYLHPAEHPPPLGTKLLLLTRGGVCVQGHWDPDVGCVAWAPLPKIPADLRERLAREGVKV